MDDVEEGNNKIDSEDEKFLKSLYYNVKQPTAFAREEILWENIKLHDGILLESSYRSGFLTKMFTLHIGELYEDFLGEG